jgi:hypothetical protein
MVSVAATTGSSLSMTRSLFVNGDNHTNGGWLILAFFSAVVLLCLACAFCMCLSEGPVPCCCCPRRRRIEGDNDESESSSRDDCCVFQAGGRFIIRGRQQSDEEYRRNVRRRELLERRRQLGTPEQRRRKVLQSFARCKVIKVSATTASSSLLLRLVRSSPPCSHSVVVCSITDHQGRGSYSW